MIATPPSFAFEVEAFQTGKRLDVVLSDYLPECSRSAASQLIVKGLVNVNGQCAKPSYRVRLGDAVDGRLPEPRASQCLPEPIPLSILYEDPFLIVVNKPPGLVVHPAPGHASGTLVNALLHHCADLHAIDGEIRPGIVHRLDKDTSGALVIAKGPAAHQHLSHQFKHRAVRKTYLAIVRGEMKSSQGRIVLPIGRHPVERKKMSTRAAKARSAETHYRIRQMLRGATLLELDLKTGRTHQIRVHCAALQHPVLGDPVYGGRQQGASTRSGLAPGNAAIRVGRQMLHAWQLGFSHPHDGRWCQFEAPMPDDMQHMLSLLRL